MLDFLSLQTTSANATAVSAIYTVLLSFLLSSLIAITYEKTFRGLSYSRNYVQSLVLSSIIAATVMQAIGDSLARGLGMIGALAIIRFRTVFKDPRDIIFMFASLASGIACGVFAYLTGIIGTIAFCVAAFVLHAAHFGQSRLYDGMVRFNAPAGGSVNQAVETAMREFCRNFVLITVRELAQAEQVDYSYHISLRKGKSGSDLLRKLTALTGISNVNVMLQETTVEL